MSKGKGDNDDSNSQSSAKSSSAKKMTKTDNENPPIILEGVGWKRRSGFGKYSETVGVGSSWERRRFALTAKPPRLMYYSESESSKSLLEEFPRGTLKIIAERATITARSL